ncbi:MAG: sensor histidine kinase [Bacillota bacterium]
MSIRLKLTLWYSSVVAITVAVFSVILYTLVWRTTFRDIDLTIKARAESVASSIFVAQGMHAMSRPIMIPDVDVFSEADIYVQVMDPQGNVVAKSANLGRQSLPLSPEDLAMALNGSFFKTQTVGRFPVRTYTVPLTYRNYVVGFVQVGRALRPTLQALTRLRLTLVLVGLFTVVLAGAFGWWLSKAALRPIERLTNDAREIGEKMDFARRVAYVGPQDEVGRLAATFNMMLANLETAYKRLEQALASQKRFVADASHELRTPLTVIRGNVELLKRCVGVDAEGTKEAIEDIEYEVERLSRMAGELLDLARADAGQHLELVPVDLVSLLRSMEKRLAMLANGRRFQLKLETGVQEATVLGSKDHIERLLTILVDNGVKYTEPQGEIEVGLELSGEYAMLWVRDNGSGIAPEDLPHIFERFYRADKTRSRGGTGLGLAIAKWIVSEHGGEITVHSELGKGSVFQVKIPLLREF